MLYRLVNDRDIEARLAFKLDLVHVPFTGAGPAIQATVGGHTPIAFTALPPTKS